VGAWSLALAAVCLASFWLAARYERDAPWTLSDAAQAEAAADDPRADDTRTEDATGVLVAKITVSALAIFAAGYSLAQTGDALAKQTGLGTGIVGFVLIGVSTSLPELSSITAALRIRRYEMAIGEVLGTNFVNIALILLADAVFAGGPVIDELGRFEATSALLGVTLTGMILIGLLERRNPTVLRMGYDSLAVVVLFAGGVALLFGVE
jgi:cation:H+ antiporter